MNVKAILLGLRVAVVLALLVSVGFNWQQAQTVGGLRQSLKAVSNERDKAVKAKEDQADTDARAYAVLEQTCAAEGGSAYQRGVQVGRAICEVRQ